MAVNGFGIGFLLALTMVIIFSEVRSRLDANSDNDLAEAAAVEMVDRRDHTLQRSAMADANALDR